MSCFRSGFCLLVCLWLTGCADATTRPAAAPVRFHSAIPNLLVRNLPAAERFYVDTLGFQRHSGGSNFILLQRDQVRLGLIQSAVGAGQSWCTLRVDHPEVLYRQYQSAGVPLAVPLTDWGHGHFAFTISDPDGNTLDFGN